MTQHTTTLLRRTLAVVAALAGLMFAIDVPAGTVTLSGGTGSCTYTGMSIDPAGNFVVTCSSGGGSGGTSACDATQVGTFALSTAGSNVSPNTAIQLSVVRTGGCQGAVTVQYNVAGCATAPGSVSFGNGDAASKTFTLTSLGSGTCMVTIYNPTPSSTQLVAPTSAFFPVVAGASGGSTSGSTGGTGGTTTTLAGCPSGFAPPSDLKEASLPGPGNYIVQTQGSAQVVAIPLPPLSALSGSSIGQVVFSESSMAYLPVLMQPGIEISINKCKGYVDTNTYDKPGGSFCNISSMNGNYNNVAWYATAFGGVTDEASAKLSGYCWAGDAGVQYYINARWTYSSCAYGNPVCGYLVQYNRAS